MMISLGSLVEMVMMRTVRRLRKEGELLIRFVLGALVDLAKFFMGPLVNIYHF